MSEYYLIKRGLFYRPDAKGYTNDIREAGRFSYDYARMELIDTHGEVQSLIAAPETITDPLKY